MFVVRQGRKDDINKEGCCEKWWNVTVRVVGAVLDSGAQRVVVVGGSVTAPPG